MTNHSTEHAAIVSAMHDQIVHLFALGHHLSREQENAVFDGFHNIESSVGRRYRVKCECCGAHVIAVNDAGVCDLCDQLAAYEERVMDGEDLSDNDRDSIETMLLVCQWQGGKPEIDLPSAVELRAMGV